MGLRVEPHLGNANNFVVNDAELFCLARRHVRVALQRRVDLLGATPAVLLDDVAQRLARVLGLVRRRVGRRDRRDACGGPRRERTSLPCNPQPDSGHRRRVRACLCLTHSIEASSTNQANVTPSQPLIRCSPVQPSTVRHKPSVLSRLGHKPVTRPSHALMMMSDVWPEMTWCGWWIMILELGSAYLRTSGAKGGLREHT